MLIINSNAPLWVGLLYLGTFALGGACIIASYMGRKQREKACVLEGSNTPYYAKDVYRITVSSCKGENGEVCWKSMSEDYEGLSSEDETPELAIEGLFEKIEEKELEEREKENKDENN